MKNLVFLKGNSQDAEKLNVFKTDILVELYDCAVGSYSLGAFMAERRRMIQRKESLLSIIISMDLWECSNTENNLIALYKDIARYVTGNKKDNVRFIFVANKETLAAVKEKITIYSSELDLSVG